jgi:hypothetical protein
MTPDTPRCVAMLLTSTRETRTEALGEALNVNPRTIRRWIGAPHRNPIPDWLDQQVRDALTEILPADIRAELVQLLSDG